MKNRLLTLALGLTIVAIITITLIAIDSANSVSRRAQEISSQSLRTQAEAYLKQINSSTASQNDLILDRAARDVRTVAQAASAIYGSDLPVGGQSALAQLHREADGQWMNDAKDVSSVFVPNTTGLTAEVRQDVEKSAYLDLVLEPIFKNNPNAGAIYLGTVNDVTRYYPNIELGKVVPPDFRVSQRVWYTTSLEENAGQSEPDPVWSPVYVDATGLGLVTTVAMPVYDPKGILVGVVGLDLTLNEIYNNIEMARFLQSGYSFLVDKEGNGIILPDQGYLDFLGRERVENEFGTNLRSEEALAASPEFAAIVDRMVKNESGFESVQAGGEELFVAFAPLSSTGWSLGSVVAAPDVLQSVSLLKEDLQQTTQTVVLTRVIPIVGAFSALLLLLGLIWTNRLVNPIQRLAEAARKIGAGQLDVVIPVESNDEIGTLASTLNSMAAQLHQTFSELEQRVLERTNQLERRSLQLQTAAEVARDITTAQELEAMLQNAVNLISNRFGLYNVGIFLVDEAGEYVQLKAASGELGKILIGRNIKLKVGQQGIVGFVTRYGQPRIAADVEADRVYVAEPLLPETRSEVALPLRAGEKIIGALDVQSTREAAFDREDVTVLQTLADQLAIAIENLRLVGKLQSTLEEISLLYQEQVQEAWSNPTLEAPTAYEYNRLEVRPIESVSLSEALSMEQQPSRLVVPVKLRGQVIGYIGLESDDPTHQWSEDEIAVIEAIASQAAQTLENARLLNESQHRASREKLTAEVSTRIRASLDVESVLKTAVDEIYQALRLDNLVIQLAQAPGEPGGEGQATKGNGGSQVEKAQ